MRRTVPLFITAMAGVVLLASRFVPYAQSWGEVFTIWFDVLAAVAFVLGGGSLFKLHLRKISDRAPGWGYSGITLAAFCVTLFVGLGKIGSKPADQQEFYGQSFAPLDVDDLPSSTTARVPGVIPSRPDGEQLPLSVKSQLRQEGNQLVFRGWMTPRQQLELSEYDDSLAWQCAVERLFDASQPKPPLAGKVSYLADHRALAVRGYATSDVIAALRGLSGNDRWDRAVEVLERLGRREARIQVVSVPHGFRIPSELKDFLSYDAATHELGIRGPMSTALRDRLAGAWFPLVRPLSAEARIHFQRELEALGSPLNPKQAKSLESGLQKSWVVDKLRVTLDEAGKAVRVAPTACESEAARKAGRPLPQPQKSGPDVVLNGKQRAALDRFAADPAMTVESLLAALKAAGPFNDRQQAAVEDFFAGVPTVGEQRLELCVRLLRDGALSSRQYEFLVSEFREQFQWRKAVGDLFVKAHVTKYPWSGKYNEVGSVFGWIYEFVFKPLLATMFSLLAFYVASAAFRAFRAKNLGAILLLATAFIILLGQTFAGYWLTSWIPENSPAAVLKIRNLIAWVTVFQTAGTRAIMIGIALGVGSTSLKILLGIDRSYLGTGD